MKAKQGEKAKICPTCKKEMTVNYCELHSNSKDDCYYCHLNKEHVVKDKKEEVKK